jgi:hypothetical protein
MYRKGMVRKKLVKTADCEAKSVDGEPVSEKGEDIDFLGILVEKVVQQVNIQTLAAKLAPELADKLLSIIEIDTLKEYVLEMLAGKVAEDPVLIDAIAMRVMAKLG